MPNKPDSKIIRETGKRIAALIAASQRRGSPDTPEQREFITMANEACTLLSELDGTRESIDASRQALNRVERHLALISRRSLMHVRAKFTPNDRECAMVLAKRPNARKCRPRRPDNSNPTPSDGSSAPTS